MISRGWSYRGTMAMPAAQLKKRRREGWRRRVRILEVDKSTEPLFVRTRQGRPPVAPLLGGSDPCRAPPLPLGSYPQRRRRPRL